MAISGPLPRALIYSVVVASFAVLVTWLTGFVGMLYEHGLPFAWKEGGCPPPPIEAVCLVISYNWIAFGLDVLFYFALGYGLLLGYTVFHERKHAFLFLDFPAEVGNFESMQF